MHTLGKYEVIAELASGSMGIIYRARDTILDREVALKTIAGTGSLDPELKERFYREARAGARLHHPNVITVYELGEQDGLVFIALELLSGCDLRQFIAQRRPLPAVQRIAIMAAVCDGLHHAHKNGITHRDIKPSNVFLTDDHVPKLLDFGVARLSASKLTVVGRVLGTPFYMAPEQIMGQPCDNRSDLFSLAIVTFEFLTYAHPFAGESIPKRIMNEDPDSAVKLNPELPAELDAVLRKALAKDPTRRYQTVEEFGQALRAVIRPAPAAATVVEKTPAAEPPSRAPAAAIPPQYANTEYKMSAILLALQGFDEAIDQRNLAVARNALATVEMLAKVDDRFATAAKESRTRLRELEASLPPQPVPVDLPAPPPIVLPEPVAPPPVSRTPPPRTPPPVSDVPKPAPVTRPPNFELPPAPPAQTPAPSLRRTLMPQSQPAPESSPDDATSMFNVPGISSAPLPRPATRPPVSPPAATSPPRPGTAPPVFRPSVTAPPETRTMVPPLPRRSPAIPSVQPAVVQQPAPSLLSRLAKLDSTILVVAGAAGTLILIAVVAWAFSRGGKVAQVPAVGTAQVAVPQSSIFQDPSDSAGLVVTLKKGDSVNVIRPPRSRSQEWTEVQSVSGKTVFPAGAMHTADLTNWSSAKPDVALYFIEMYAPGPDAGETELRQYAQNLSSFLQHFGKTAQQADVQAELDKTNAAIARLGKSKSGPQARRPRP